MNIIDKILRIPEEPESIKDNKPLSYPFFSSFLFLIPTIYAYRRKEYQISIGSFIVFIASIFNHGTHNKTINNIDKTISVTLITYFTLFHCSFNICYFITLTAVITAFILFCCCRISFDANNGLRNHSIIHIISATGIMFLIKSKK